MRPPPYWIPLTVAITLMGTLIVSAQDWQTMEDFAPAPGNAEAHGVAVDGAGGIYVAGTANGHAIVRYSGDGGANWITRNDFVYPSETNNLFNSIIIDHQGALFVGGASGGHWIVRRSTDQGVTWETVDDYFGPRIPPGQGTNGNVYSLSSDGLGRIYGAGNMQITGPTYPRWWVRGSGIGGTNWDTKLVVFAGYGGVSQLTCAGEDIYVTGTTSDSETTIGYILRSSDHGATWTTNFQAAHEAYYAITSDSAGNIYAAGNRWNSTNGWPTTTDWLVRKAAPGGTNWTTLDAASYNDSADGGMAPSSSSIAIDAAGNMCVAGKAQNSWVIYGTNSTTYAGNETWFTRQFSAASGQWSTSDLFSYYPTNSPNWTNMHSVAVGAAIAPDGSTFVVGYGTTESGQRRWVVRKRSALPAPRLEIAVAGGSVTVSWPAAYTNSILEWTDSPGTNQTWHTVATPVSVTDNRNTATFALTPGPRFLRLKSAAGH